MTWSVEHHLPPLPACLLRHRHHAQIHWSNLLHLSSVHQRVSFLVDSAFSVGDHGAWLMLLLSHLQIKQYFSYVIDTISIICQLSFENHCIDTKPKCTIILTSSMNAYIEDRNYRNSGVFGKSLILRISSQISQTTKLGLFVKESVGPKLEFCIGFRKETQSKCT